jgi:hypothetical protein
MVRALISHEERLPVVTEYVLRALRVCRSLSADRLRGFFGFSDFETKAVVSAMVRQGLVELSGESVSLTSFAAAQFQSPDDDYPIFAKVEQVRDEVEFDLMSFTPLGKRLDTRRSDVAVEVRVGDEIVGHSIDLAKAAYNERFSEIAARREDFKRQRASVYSVQAVQSRQRFALPVTVEFALGLGLRLERRLPSGLGEKTSPEFEAKFQEHVTKLIGAGADTKGGRLRGFIDDFELAWLADYIKDRSFPLDRFLRDVDEKAVRRLPDTVEPLYGNLYTAMNREVLKNRIAYYVSRWKEKKQCRIKWMPPVDWMWGRDTQFTDLLNEAEDYVEKRGGAAQLGHRLSWDFVLRANGAEGDAARQRLRRVLPKCDAIKVRSNQGESQSEVDERLELCVFFDEFMVALCHLSTKGSPGVFVPVGFMSAQREHVEIAKRIITAVSHS